MARLNEAEANKREQVLRAFRPVEITDSQLDDVRIINESAYAFATRLLALIPGSREQSLALTKLEEAVMWATAGVFRYATIEPLNVPVHAPDHPSRSPRVPDGPPPTRPLDTQIVR